MIILPTRLQDLKGSKSPLTKKCSNAEPLNLVFYPLIHCGLPNILKLSNFQVLYHFGKLLSSRFQNCYRFCNILKIGHFTGQQRKKGHFFCSPFSLRASYFVKFWNRTLAIKATDKVLSWIGVGKKFSFTFNVFIQSQLWSQFSFPLD